MNSFILKFFYIYSYIGKFYNFCLHTFFYLIGTYGIFYAFWVFKNRKAHLQRDEFYDVFTALERLYAGGIIFRSKEVFASPFFHYFKNLTALNMYNSFSSNLASLHKAIKNPSLKIRSLYYDIITIKFVDYIGRFFFRRLFTFEDYNDPAALDFFEQMIIHRWIHYIDVSKGNNTYLLRYSLDLILWNVMNFSYIHGTGFPLFDDIMMYQDKSKLDFFFQRDFNQKFFIVDYLALEDRRNALKFVSAYLFYLIIRDIYFKLAERFF